MRLLIRLQMCATILAACGTATAAPVPHAQCPLKITPTSMKIDAEPDWMPFAAVPLPLHSAGMSAGPPPSLLRLRGEPISENKGAFITRYALHGTGFEEGKWLDCFYGDAGEISISRRLDDRLKRCTITLFGLTRSEPRRINIECE